MSLEAHARAWIGPYSQALHLERTLDWLLELDPDAGEALRLAALTHDMERHFPGGPVQDKANAAWDDPAYLRAHSERSARVVGDWLAEQGAAPELIADVQGLIELHETGGSPRADLLQVADSISFLETLADLAADWVRTGACSLEQAGAKHGYMFDRIRLERARAIAEPYFDEAMARIAGVAIDPAIGDLMLKGET
jgi:hypothetical protein